MASRVLLEITDTGSPVSYRHKDDRDHPSHLRLRRMYTPDRTLHFQQPFSLKNDYEETDFLLGWDHEYTVNLNADDQGNAYYLVQGWTVENQNEDIQLERYGGATNYVPMNRVLTEEIAFVAPDHDHILIRVRPLGEGERVSRDDPSVFADPSRLTVADTQRILSLPKSKLLAFAALPEAPTEILDLLGRFLWCPLLKKLALNPNISPDLLVRLAKYMPTMALENPSLPLVLLEDPELRERLGPHARMGLEAKGI